LYFTFITLSRTYSGDENLFCILPLEKSSKGKIQKRFSSPEYVLERVLKVKYKKDSHPEYVLERVLKVKYKKTYSGDENLFCILPLELFLEHTQEMRIFFVFYL
jgi:hypothetical protein